MIKKIDTMKDTALLEKFEKQVDALRDTIVELQTKGYKAEVHTPSFDSDTVHLFANVIYCVLNNDKVSLT